MWKDYFPPKWEQVDVDLYDKPSDAAPLQWWYVHAHLKLVGGDESGSSDANCSVGENVDSLLSDASNDLGFFASFFRQNHGAADERESSSYDACTWAVMDYDRSEYHASGLVDVDCFRAIQARLDDADSTDLTEFERETMRNILRTQKIPQPQKRMRQRACVTSNPTSINLDDTCIISMRSETCGRTGTRRRVYELTVRNAERGTAAHLYFVSDTLEPVVQGENGVVNDMFYYYFPSMDVHGTITLDGKVRQVRGRGWYDRELGGSPSRKGREAQDAWSWYSLLLSTGASLNLFLITDAVTQERSASAVYVDRSGNQMFFNEVRHEVRDTWTSLRTFIEYTSTATLRIPEIGLECTVRPRFAHQEFATIVVPGGGFYEGCVVGHGHVGRHVGRTSGGTELSVIGFFEQKVACTPRSTEQILGCVSRYVQRVLASYYPLDANEEWIRENVLGTTYGNVSQHISPRVLCDALFRPVRHLIDNGGKAWRSLILVSCCNALSHNYFDCTRYIAMAELLHVGSLIIDDIEDNSIVRRGAPAVHLLSGVPTAINAGTLCYFMAPCIARIDDLPPLKSLRVHQLYLNVLRLAHVGQGLDIAGLDMYMPDVVRTGDTTALEKALHSIHAYKTGLVSGSACRIACIVCDAADTLTDAMDSFGTNVGIAFQIIDDALNISGFKNGLKERAEDIRDGKITAPIVLALAQLGLDDRDLLWRTLKSKPQSDWEVGIVSDLILKTNAIEACRQKACTYIEDGWSLIDPLLDESHSKNILHTFCKFLLDRDF